MLHIFAPRVFEGMRLRGDGADSERRRAGLKFSGNRRASKGAKRESSDLGNIASIHSLLGGEMHIRKRRRGKWTNRLLRASVAAYCQ
jgi:hypothetical protein